jgi:hypothetical protein
MISAAPPQAWWMESGHIAEMGDLFILAIYICQLCDANSFDGGLDAVEPPQDTGKLRTHDDSGSKMDRVAGKNRPPAIGIGPLGMASKPNSKGTSPDWFVCGHFILVCEGQLRERCGAGVEGRRGCRGAMDADVPCTTSDHGFTVRDYVIAYGLGRFKTYKAL